MQSEFDRIKSVKKAFTVEHRIGLLKCQTTTGSLTRGGLQVEKPRNPNAGVSIVDILNKTDGSQFRGRR